MVCGAYVSVSECARVCANEDGESAVRIERTLECRHESIDSARIERYRPCHPVPTAKGGFRLAGQRLCSPHEGLLVLFHSGKCRSKVATRLRTRLLLESIF